MSAGPNRYQYDLGQPNQTLRTSQNNIRASQTNLRLSRNNLENNIRSPRNSGFSRNGLESQIRSPRNNQENQELQTLQGMQGNMQESNQDMGRHSHTHQQAIKIKGPFQMMFSQQKGKELYYVVKVHYHQTSNNPAEKKEFIVPADMIGQATEELTYYI